MPYPNEHACRLIQPNRVTVTGRTTRRHNGKPYSIIWGRLKSGTDRGKVKEQAYRYKKTIWSAGEARTHCRNHGGSFEAAKRSEVDNEMEIETKKIDVYFDIQKAVLTEKATEDIPKGSRVIEGFIATSHKDDMGDVITPKALKELSTTLRRRPALLLNHDPTRPVGRMVRSEVRGVNGETAVWMKDIISSTEDEVWTKIQEKIISQYSIRILIRDYEFVNTGDKDNPEETRYIKSLLGLEHSLALVPVNAEANNLGSYIQKAFLGEDEGEEKDISSTIDIAHKEGENEDEGDEDKSVEETFEEVFKEMDPARKNLLMKAVSAIGKLFGLVSSDTSKSTSEKENINPKEGEFDMDNIEELLASKEVSEKIAAVVGEKVEEAVSKAVEEAVEHPIQNAIDAATKAFQDLMDEAKKESTERAEALTKRLEESEKVSKELKDEADKSKEELGKISEAVTQLAEAGGESSQLEHEDDREGNEEKMDLGLAFLTAGNKTVAATK